MMVTATQQREWMGWMNGRNATELYTDTGENGRFPATE